MSATNKNIFIISVTNKNIFKQINDAAQELIQLLHAQGVIIQRYDASSTNSIYLKFDYGTANSIRISDHRGKTHLKYRYNLMADETKVRSEMDKYQRYYWPIDQVQACAELILKERQAKIDRFGLDRYKSFMEQNRTDHTNDKGFWSDAWLVKP